MYIVAAAVTYVLLLMIFLALLFGLCVGVLTLQALAGILGRALSAIRASGAESDVEGAPGGFNATPAVPARP